MRRSTVGLIPAVISVCVALPAALIAQAPSLSIPSPFHEIRNGRYIELIGGRVAGSGGPLQVGPRDGTAYGARVVFRAKNTIQISFGGWTAATQRSVVDPDDSVATRVKDAVDQRLIAAEASVQFNLTGGKRWHALAPFVGMALGMARGQNLDVGVDTSGYSFGTKFYFAPNIGTKVFLSQRAFVKLEARALFWKLKYPPSFGDEPADQPGTPESPNALNPTRKTGEYTATPALFIGVGWAFSRLAAD